MKYPEYDSPFELIINNIMTQAAKQIDEECWQAIQRVGINVNKETLLRALKFDSTRYREAFRRGEETGYTKRDEEIIRCKNCKHFEPFGIYTMCHRHNGLPPNADWFCADGEREEFD